MKVWLADQGVDTATPAHGDNACRDAQPRAVLPAPLPNIPLIDGPMRRAFDVPQPELKPLPERHTILVVDDDPRMLDLAVRFLQRENLEVLSAWSGSEALRVVGEHVRQGGKIDVLLTDFVMPRMDGRQLAARIRERFPSIKVLYETGFADLLFDQRPELEEGAAFVEKPFSARGLREALRFLLFESMNAPEPLHDTP